MARPNSGASVGLWAEALLGLALFFGGRRAVRFFWGNAKRNEQPANSNLL